MDTLRSKLLRLAQQKPELRPHLLPVLKVAVMLSEPKVLDPQDPKTPKIRGKKLVRVWRLVKDKASIYETEGRTFGIMVNKVGESLLSPAARSGYGIRSTVRGMLIYRDRDVGAVLYENPTWRSAWAKVTGKTLTFPDDLPIWYEEYLVADNELPITTSVVLDTAFRRNGWKQKDDRTLGKGYIKQFGGVYVRVDGMDRIYGTTLYIRANNFPRGLGMDQWDAFRDNTSVEVDYRDKLFRVIEDAAAKVAAKIKAWKPARRKTDYDDFEWDGETGPKAYKAWQTKVQEILFDSIKGAREYHDSYMRANKDSPWFDYSHAPAIGRSTADLTSEVRAHYGMDYLFSRALLGKKVRAILERMARKGLIQKEGRGSHLRWVYEP